MLCCSDDYFASITHFLVYHLIFAIYYLLLLLTLCLSHSLTPPHLSTSDTILKLSFDIKVSRAGLTLKCIDEKQKNCFLCPTMFLWFQWTESRADVHHVRCRWWMEEPFVSVWICPWFSDDYDNLRRIKCLF